MLDEEGVTSQVEVIGSTDILKQVAQKLDLSKLPEFDDAADMSLLGRFLIVVGLKNDPNEIPPEERVLKKFREKLNIYRVEKSRVIVIEMSSENPELAAKIPNTIADVYLAVQRGAKLQSNADATDWLAPEIADLSKRVKDAEARVAAFRSQSDLLIGQNNSVLATQQLSELSTELSRVRAGRGAAEATAQSVRAALQSGASLDAFPEVLSSELIQRLRERQVQLKADIADLSTTLLDNHPRIRALRSQLADLDEPDPRRGAEGAEGPGDAGADRKVPRDAADRRPQHGQGGIGARRRRGGRAALAGARSRRPARAAGILPDALPRGIVAQGPQLPAGRRPHLLQRRGAVPSRISRRSCRSSAPLSSPRC